jgi:hypothetical protein
MASRQRLVTKWKEKENKKVRAEKQCQIMRDNETLTMPLLYKQIGDKRKRVTVEKATK